MEPGDRLIDRSGFGKLGVGEGPFRRDVAIPPFWRPRQASEMKGAELRIAVQQGEALRDIGIVTGALVHQGIGACDDGWGRLLFGSHQKTGATQSKADAAKSGAPGKNNRADKAEDRWRHPGDKRRRNRETGDKAQDPHHHMRAVPPHDVRKGDRPVVAPLRVPAGIKAEHEMHDVAGLNQHHDRSEQSRHDDLEESRNNKPGGAASPPPRGTLDQRESQAKKLGKEEDRHGDAEKLERSLRIEPRPCRKQCEVAWEIFGPDVARLQNNDDTNKELRQPERRGHIGHDSCHEMLPRHQMQPLRGEYSQMLEVALTPAAVACRKIDQRRRTFLIAAAETWQHIDRVTGAPDQRGLDKIMAENMPAERRPPAQHGQTAMGGESPGTNNRVMAPVIAIAPRGDGKARGDHRPIDARRELLKAGK